MSSVSPAAACLFIPRGLKDFKLRLFERIGATIVAAGGQIVRDNPDLLAALPDDVVPIVGCSPELRELIADWRQRGREWVYWDRGYCRRVFASDLPWGSNGGYYRWHRNAFQLREVRTLPDDRWHSMKTPLADWKRDGQHIVIAEPSETYQRFHGITGWKDRVVAEIRRYTDRPLIFRDKEMQRFGRKLHEDLAGAHCLVTHGSNAAVEAVIMGCPVFVHPDSAAVHVGRTDLAEIENPLYCGRRQWLNSLSHSQFNERELVDGTLWRMIV